MITDLDCLFISQGFDLVILNRPGLTGLYKELYTLADNVFCVDGAANRLFSELANEIFDFLPSVVIGDMDSISPEAYEFFSKSVQGLTFVVDNDQNTTDLEKVLKLSKKRVVIVLTDNAGRLDHTFGAFSAIADEAYAARQIYLYGIGNIAFIARNGDEIRGSDWKYCGLIPIFGRALISTQGLKWNISNKFIQMGKFISVCNEFTGPVKIDTDTPILITISKE